MNYKKSLLPCILTLLTVTLYGQGSDDFFRSIGKIYVVVAVVAVTFIGIVGFLIYIERKLKNIEQEISSHEEVSEIN